MNDVLLTVSGEIPADIEAQIARGERPEADYIAMARSFGADLADFNTARAHLGGLGRVIERLAGPKLLLAIYCFLVRSRYRVLFTDGEQIGLPLAFLLKFSRSRPSHQMIVHILSVGKKQRLIDLFRLQHQIDVFFVYSTWQKQFIQHRWGVSAERVVFTPFMVDAEFFKPEAAGAGNELIQRLKADGRPILCAVGLEFRDYPTLISAVEDLPVQVVIAAASPWSKRSDTTAGQTIPDNVTVSKFTQHELRDVYAASAFMVMPLYDVAFQAGVTALLEAMSMERAVICSRTQGQTDVVVDGQTGIYVQPENPAALRRAIETLLESPETAAKMGHLGRERILQSMSLKRYTARLGRYVAASPTHLGDLHGDPLAP